jgi:hypothetical protein
VGGGEAGGSSFPAIPDSRSPGATPDAVPSDPQAAINKLLKVMHKRTNPKVFIDFPIPKK